MRVDHVEVQEVAGSLRRSAQDARRTWTERRGLMVLLHAGGLVGRGEASPLPEFSLETFSFARECLEHADEFLPALVSELRANGVPIPLEYSAATPVNAPTSCLSKLCSSARFALETALLDWAGQATGEPAHQLLRRSHLAGDRVRSEVPLCAMIPSAERSTWLAQASTLIDAGYRHLKVKVGRDWVGEVETLQELCRELVRRGRGADSERSDATSPIAVRIDANGALHDLRDTLPMLEELSLEFFEEPAPWPQLRELGALPVPVALDESLLNLPSDEELKRLLREGWASVLVLKPTVLGGVLRTLHLARIAQQSGASVVVSHALDGPIARACAAEMCLTIDTPKAAGLGEHAALEVWPAMRAASISQTALHEHHEPGLGLSFR